MNKKKLLLTVMNLVLCTTYLHAMDSGKKSNSSTDKSVNFAKKTTPREQLDDHVLMLLEDNKNPKAVLGKIKTLLKQHPEIINEKNDLGYTILHGAIAAYICRCFESDHYATNSKKYVTTYHAQLIDLLLSQQGLDVNAKSIGGISPLIMFLKPWIYPQQLAKINLVELDSKHDKVIQKILSRYDVNLRQTVFLRFLKGIQKILSRYDNTQEDSQTAFLAFSKKCVLKGHIDLYDKLAKILGNHTWPEEIAKELKINVEQFRVILETFDALHKGKITDATINAWLQKKYPWCPDEEPVKGVVDKKQVASLRLCSKFINEHSIEPLKLILLQRVKQPIKKVNYNTGYLVCQSFICS